MKEKTLLSSKDLERKTTRIVHEILEDNNDNNDIAIVGIKTRGEYLGRRIVEELNTIEKKEIPFGTLDITLYRDDLRNNLALPELKETNIPFNVENKTIILVDDVLFTGRTIRAAIDAIMDFGRPANIKLAVLVDRGLRELPIQADYIGLSIETVSSQKIKVFLKEKDKKDKVVLLYDNGI
jgi:pyrimidine operon attenuation protein / uracil phosphoribosyltransferase